MNMHFRSESVELTEDVRGYVQEKISLSEKVLGDIPEENISYDVELSKDTTKHSGEIYRADVTMHFRGDRVHAVGHGETIHAAIDLAKDELTRRLSRGKNKKRSMFLRGAQKIKQMLKFGNSE